jgi:hypothetical protein
MRQKVSTAFAIGIGLIVFALAVAFAMGQAG